MSKFASPPSCSLLPFPPVSPPFLFSFLPTHVKTCLTSGLAITNKQGSLLQGFNKSIGINLRKEKPRGSQLNSLKQGETNIQKKKGKIMSDRLKKRSGLGCHLCVML